MRQSRDTALVKKSKKKSVLYMTVESFVSKVINRILSVASSNSMKEAQKASVHFSPCMDEVEIQRLRYVMRPIPNQFYGE